MLVSKSHVIDSTVELFSHLIAPGGLAGDREGPQHAQGRLQRGHVEPVLELRGLHLAEQVRRKDIVLCNPSHDLRGRLGLDPVRDYVN